LRSLRGCLGHPRGSDSISYRFYNARIAVDASDAVAPARCSTLAQPSRAARTAWRRDYRPEERPDPLLLTHHDGAIGERTGPTGRETLVGALRQPLDGGSLDRCVGSTPAGGIGRPLPERRMRSAVHLHAHFLRGRERSVNTLRSALMRQSIPNSSTCSRQTP
jgi:hypothetical protein